MIPSLREAFANEISAGRLPRSSKRSDIDRATFDPRDDLSAQRPPRPGPPEHLAVLNAIDSLVSSLPETWRNPAVWASGGSLPLIGDQGESSCAPLDSSNWGSGSLPTGEGVSSPLFTLHTTVHSSVSLSVFALRRS